MIKRCLLLFMLICCISPSFSEGINDRPAVTVSGDVAILMDKAEDAPVKRAVQDLVRDMKKVFGKEPKVISFVAEAGKNAPLIVVTCKGVSTKSFRNPGISQFESHLVTTGKVGTHKAVILQGADMRGTIYAIYTFSEKFLGIPPLWIWTSYKPQIKNVVQVPEKTYLYYSTPTVKWRAWFPNDRDLLDPWMEKNAENYDAVFETMLRLKLNTREGYLMDGSSWKTPYKAGKEACYARDRGLKVSFTHTAPFGAVLKNWDNYWTKIRKQQAPPLLIKNVQGLKDFWQYHIETIQKEKLDVIWQLGFRGMGDKPFWRKTYADAMDEPKEDKDRAAIINSMLAEQVALLKKVTGEEHPQMKITIYNENSDFMAAGLLHLPDEPSLILNYSAARGDHYPPPEIQNFTSTGDNPIGYYMNFQFTGTGSHLAPAEGPWKMEQSFRYVVAKIKRPLNFSVVNAGNIREYGLELSANAAMMWNFDTYKTDDFLKSYCAMYYGEKYANDISALYKDYYNSYWLPKKGDIPGFDRQYVFQDLRYARGLEQICALWDHPYLENPFNDKNKGVGGAMATGGRQYNIVPADNNAPNQVEAAIARTQQSAKKFQAVVNQADMIYQKLPDSAKPFFNDDLRLQAMFMAQVNTILADMVEAYRDKAQGKTADCKNLVEQAQKGLLTLKGIKLQADHGRFDDWYAKEKNFGIDEIEKNVTEVLKKIN
jgi:hypothetical protein